MQAQCHVKVLDHLKLDRVHAVLGGSLGGMQVNIHGRNVPKKVLEVFFRFWNLQLNFHNV